MYILIWGKIRLWHYLPLKWVFERLTPSLNLLLRQLRLSLLHVFILLLLILIIHLLLLILY
jgi:hypothetical protein